jgi:valyl-tRNA synthetase
VEPGKRIIAYLAGGEYAEVLTHQQEILVNLARLDADQLTIVSALDEKPEQSVSQVISGGIEIYLPLAGMIDLDAEKERLEKELAQLEQRITGSEKKLENKNFVEKAPADVVQRERDRLEDMKVQAEKIKKQIEDFG